MTTVNLSLVIPVFNEAANLDELVRRCIRVCDDLQLSYEIILVDDGSRDQSRQILRDKAREHAGRVVALILNRNYGQHRAVLAGLAHSKGDVVVTLDADLQNPPEEIPKLLERIAAGCDVVGSFRKNRRDSWLRRLPSRTINYIVRRSTGLAMRDFGCMLRAYRRDIVDAILNCPERSTFIPVLANQFAGRADEVEVLHNERFSGASKYGFWKLINLQFDLITSMTAFPLRLLSVGGGLMAVLGFLAGSMLLVMRFIYGAEWAADGVLTVLAGLFVFAGVQLFALGLIGEYLGRVYDDMRGRPRYFVQEVHDGRPGTQARANDVIELSRRREEKSP